MVLIGFNGWVDAADTVESQVEALIGGVGAIGIAFALINVSKEKFGIALLGLVVPIVAVVGAFRLAKPNSLWAKLFYRRGKLRRSKQRFAGERGKPFWKRGPELRGRLRLRRA
jgi:hypothetical protein